MGLQILWLPALHPLYWDLSSKNVSKLYFVITNWIGEIFNLSSQFVEARRVNKS